MPELNTRTYGELEQTLVGLLAHAQAEGLSESEVQQFWEVYQEILRRSRRAA
jgi:hypothetical protein